MATEQTELDQPTGATLRKKERLNEKRKRKSKKIKKKKKNLQSFVFLSDNCKNNQFFTFFLRSLSILSLCVPKPHQKFLLKEEKRKEREKKEERKRKERGKKEERKRKEREKRERKERKERKEKMLIKLKRETPLFSSFIFHSSFFLISPLPFFLFPHFSSLKKFMNNFKGNNYKPKTLKTLIKTIRPGKITWN